VTDLDRAIKVKPDYAEAHFNRGRILYLRNDLDGAFGAYTLAIKFKPELAEAHFFRAGVYGKKNEYDSAIADYTKSISLGVPNMAQAYYYRGTAYTAKKAYDLAVADYTKSISLVPKDAVRDKWSDEWLVSVNYEGRADAYCAQGKKELAASEEDNFIHLTGTQMVRCGETEIIGEDQLDKLCGGIDNSYQCAQAIERRQLKRISNSLRVKREGKFLRIKLDDGKLAVIENFEKSGEEDSVIKFSFRKYLPEIGYYLIHKQLYEGDGYLMVDARTGRKYELQALPVVSSDRQRLVTASNGISGGYNPNAVQIWRLTNEGMAIEQTIEPKDWGPSDPFWETDKTIRLTRNLPVTGAYSGKKEYVTLKLGTKWDLQL
jgi:tetratricopeptide (TPR) repeat protein